MRRVIQKDVSLNCFTHTKITEPGSMQPDRTEDKMSVIRINQAGYGSSLPKAFVSLSEKDIVIRNSADEIVKTFGPGTAVFDEASCDTVRKLELGDLPAGRYKVCCSGEERKLIVSDDPYRNALDLMIRSFYLQRCGCDLEEKYAGLYQHPACHHRKALIYEDQNISVDVSGGWHDAGDFGRYTGPAATAIGHMLYAYRLFPDAFTDSLDIPESGNGIPDLLNECRYELEWLLKMQREDGAVYHKVSTLNFAPFIMPQDDLEQEYVSPVSHCATAAVAACLALASDTWSGIDGDFSAKLLDASVRAWDWLENNPGFVPFKNPADIHTGGYGDWNGKDEILWAASELYSITGEERYLQKMNELFIELQNISTFGWSDVSGFASMKCLMELKEKIPDSMYFAIKEKFICAADRVAGICERSGYGTCITKDGYVWGSTMGIMNGACVLICAYMITGEPAYLNKALDQLNYLFGMNAVDTCFVTGVGEKPFMNPHHRACASDDVEQPIPGFVSGGPNNKYCYPQTRQKLGNETPAAKYYVDETFSADTNEVAIYWNSIAVFVCAFFEHKCVK
ncbi:MAG: glycoside hydrolase [Clostridiales bacterium]|nr:glycoside hydrolase [Clostridiales bacterium]